MSESPSTRRTPTMSARARSALPEAEIIAGGKGLTERLHRE